MMSVLKIWELILNYMQLWHMLKHKVTNKKGIVIHKWKGPGKIG